VCIRGRIFRRTVNVIKRIGFNRNDRGGAFDLFTNARSVCFRAKKPSGRDDGGEIAERARTSLALGRNNIYRQRIYHGRLWYVLYVVYGRFKINLEIRYRSGGETTNSSCAESRDAFFCCARVRIELDRITNLDCDLQ